MTRKDTNRFVKHAGVNSVFYGVAPQEVAELCEREIEEGAYARS